MARSERNASASTESASSVREAPPPPYRATVAATPLRVEDALARLVDRKLFFSVHDAPAWLVQRLERGFLALSPTRRERLVTALGDLLAQRPAEEWEAIVSTLFNRCRLDDQQAWARWVGAMQLLTAVKDECLQWEACATTLHASPGLEEQLARAAVFLSADGWPVGESLQIMAAAAPIVDRGDWLHFLERLRVTTQPQQSTAQKKCIAHAITRLSPDSWGAFGSVGQALCEGLKADADTTPLLDVLSAVFAANPQQASEAVAAATLRLCDKTLSASQRVQILRSVNHVTDARRSEFVDLCMHMRQHNMSDAQLAANVQTIADTAADKRQQHCRNLLLGHAARTHDQLDLENTSLYLRIDRTRAAIGQIQAISKKIDAKKILAEVREELKQLRPDTNTPPELNKLRAGAREVDNAWRTLTKPAKERDLSEPLLKDPPYFVGDQVVYLGTLAAQVWAVICNYRVHGATDADTDKSRENLRASYFLALASCIEDDGYRVCNTGIAQRLLQILQGYVQGICLDYATPQSLVSELAAEYARDDSAGLPAFYARASTRAAQIYDARSPAYRTFDAHLRVYLKADYDWEPAA